MDKDAIYGRLKELLISEFKLEAGSVSPEKRLDEDFDLDSLDMVDLTLVLEDDLSQKADPSIFKGARTVQDLVDLIQPLWKL